MGARAGLCLTGGGEGGGSGTQKFVYQKWPDKIFPVANFVFPHNGHFGLGGGGEGVQRGGDPPPCGKKILSTGLGWGSHTAEALRITPPPSRAQEPALFCHVTCGS